MARLSAVKTALLSALLASAAFGESSDPAMSGAEFKKAAADIGGFLLKAARRDGDAIYFAQNEGGPAGTTDEARAFPLGLYDGVAGIGFFFLSLHRATSESRWLDAAKGSGNRLLRTAQPAPGGGLCWKGSRQHRTGIIPEGDRNGLYTGNAGIGLFLLHLHSAAKDPRYLEAAEGAFERIIREARTEAGGVCWDYSSQDIIGGEAGIGLSLIEASRLTGRADFLESAKKAAVWLESKATIEAGSASWTNHGSRDPNFSHGTAGIAFFLAALGGHGARRTARFAARWVESQAAPCPGNGLLWKYYADPPPEGRQNWIMNSWCHGAPGTARLFHLLHRVTAGEEYLKTALRGAWGVSAEAKLPSGSPGFLNPTLCCGASGCLDCLLNVHADTGETRLLDESRLLGAAIVKQLRDAPGGRAFASYDEADGEAKKSPWFETGLMLGNAGIGYALLRLAARLDGKDELVLYLPDHPLAWKRPEEKSFVVMTDLAPGDPYFKAATKIREIHPEALTLDFPAGDPDAAESALRALEPRFVVFVLKPASIDMNFQGRVLKMCARMDDDPFPDFSYGYVTGATAAEAVKFAGNIAKAWKSKRPRRILEAPNVIKAPPSRAESPASPEYGVDWPKVRLAFGEESGRPMSEAEALSFLKKNLADWKGNGCIMMGGHGEPRGILGSVSGKALRAARADLFPAFVYNYACLNGCTGRAFEWIETPEERARVRAKTVKPEESMALAVIASGASGYVSSIEPRPAGPGMSAELLWALTAGETVGETRRREYAMLALGFAGWGEKGIVVPVFTEGEPRTRAKDVVRDVMMMNASGAVLFGDPAMRLAPGGKPPIRTSWTKEDDGFRLEAVLTMDSYAFTCDPYQRWGDGGMMASKIYAAAELPKGLGSVGAVDAVEVLAGGEQVPFATPAFAVERAGEKALLHVKVNVGPGSAYKAGSKAVFRVKPLSSGIGGPAPAEPAPPAAGAGPGGGAPCEKALATPWFLKKKEWVLSGFLEFVESYLKEHGEARNWGRITFAFEENAKDFKTAKVTIESESKPLKASIDDICRQLGLEYSLDKAAGTLTFRRSEGK